MFQKHIIFLILYISIHPLSDMLELLRLYAPPPDVPSVLWLVS